MAYTHSKKLLLATSISLVLSGCGGGGGGSAAPAPGPAPGFNIEDLPEVQRSVLTAQGVQDRKVAVERRLEGIRESEPIPGSVSQSTNIDGNNVTQDAFSVGIGGTAAAPEYTIEYDENTDDTAEETITIDTANLKGDEDYNPVEGSAYETLLIGGESGRAFDEGRIVILSGSNYDGDADYVAAGLWLYVPDSYNPNEVALGAFADGGTEFTNITGVTPGTATYRGGAFGLVTINHPTRGLYLADFTTKDFDDVVLTANFGLNPTIRGTITDLREGIFDDEGRDIPGTITLESTPIDSGDNGFFKGELSGNVGGVRLTGNWGGQFYGADVPEGPDWVTGTAGGGGSAGGLDINFVAAYLAEKE